MEAKEMITIGIDHNLDRARAQLTLLTRMEEKWEEMLAALS